MISGPKGSKNIGFNEKLFSPNVNDKKEFQFMPNKKNEKYICFMGTYRSLVNNAVIEGKPRT